MSVKKYLGYPSANEVAWIIAHAQPAARAETRVWWSNDESDYDDYLLEGEIDAESLDAYGKSWSNAYKIEIGNVVTSIGNYAFRVCSGLTGVHFNGTTVPAGNSGCFYGTSNLNDVYMLNIAEADVQAQLDSNISNWSLGIGDGTYHTVTIHCMDGEVVIEPTPSGSSSS